MNKFVFRYKYKKPKYKTRLFKICIRCSRRRAVLFKMFGLCRICIREMVSFGLIPGLKKASW